MKNLIITTALALAALTPGYAQTIPDTLSSPALSLRASYKGDFVANLNGGLKTGSTYLGLADLFVTFDTGKAKLWKGGTLMLHGANSHGGEPSADLIGDFQVVSNIEAGNHTFLYELWYNQQFGDVSVTAGLQDLNAEFASSDFGALFLNSSFGIHSVIADNFLAPIFPLTSAGITICWDASDRLNLKTALYKGSPVNFDQNPYNLEWDLNYLKGLLWVAEADIRCSSKSTELLKFGTFYHQFTREPDANDPSAGENMEYDYGFYVVGDHRVSPVCGSDEGLSIFYQLGVCPRNDNVAYLGGGLHYCGLLTKKNTDVLGLAMARGVMTEEAGNDETTLELTCKLQLTDALYIQPDIQYVIHPAGTDTTPDNALVALFRFGFDF